jgi:2,4-dienoyl-CoA reductase-like NADH-dependent reductase (Old Yellow Enzyme family)
LCQFLSAETNRRTDRYGGSVENRERCVREIIAGIRTRCRPDFNLGVRLSPERFGLRMREVLCFVQSLLTEGALDFIDVSLWDCFKEPPNRHPTRQTSPQGTTSCTGSMPMDRGSVRLGVAGKIMTAEEAQACLDAGMDFVLIGRGAILHHVYPCLAMADSAGRLSVGSGCLALFTSCTFWQKV